VGNDEQGTAKVTLFRAQVTMAFYMKGEELDTHLTSNMYSTGCIA